MGQVFRQKTVQFHRGAQRIETTVIANRKTDSLQVAASAYLLSKSLSGAKIKTVEKYASLILSLIEEIEFDPELNSFDDLTDTDMSNYLELVLMKDRGNSGSTINQHKIVLSEFFQFLYDQGFAELGDRFTYHLSSYAELKLAKAKGRQNSHDPYRLSERFIPENQFHLLLSFDKSKNSYIKERNEIVLRLGYEAGLRAHEVTTFENLAVGEIEAAISRAKHHKRNEVELNVFGKGKNAGKVRTIVIEPFLRRKIESFISRYRQNLGNHLICKKDGGELADDFATTLFRKTKYSLIKHGESPDADRWEANAMWTFHALRHSYATNLGLQIETGEKPLGRTYLMDRLGHSNPKTTLIYLHFAAKLLGNMDKVDEYEAEMRRKSFSYDQEEFAHD
jgi:site-specific recombinase XerD